MRNRCGHVRRRASAARLAGAAMMAAGGLMLLILVPRWVWTGALSLLLISLGFLLWRFSE